MQMNRNNTLSPKSKDVLYVKDQKRKNSHLKPSTGERKQFEIEEQSKRSFKASFKCEKLVHLKRDCQVKVCDRCGKASILRQIVESKRKKKKQILLMKARNFRNQLRSNGYPLRFLISQQICLLLCTRIMCLLMLILLLTTTRNELLILVVLIMQRKKMKNLKH